MVSEKKIRADELLFRQGKAESRSRAKKFEETNVVIAGNPANIRKRNINWTHGSVEGYIEKNCK